MSVCEKNGAFWHIKTGNFEVRLRERKEVIFFFYVKKTFFCGWKKMGSMSLVCPMCCGETFTSSQSLKYHLLSMTDNLYCPGCSERSDSVLALIEHLDYCGQPEETKLKLKRKSQNKCQLFMVRFTKNKFFKLK